MFVAPARSKSADASLFVLAVALLVQRRVQLVTPPIIMDFEAFSQRNRYSDNVWSPGNLTLDIKAPEGGTMLKGPVSA